MEQSRSRSATQLQQIGQDFYGKGSYSEALDALNAAAEAGNSTNVKLLNLRAATHQKLGDLDAALKDARNVLQLDKANIDGYLRTYKLLQIKEKPDLALKILERGLRLCTSTSAKYQTLRQSHDELSGKLSPPRQRDPFAAFPLELIELIFQYVPFDQVCRCLRVSKHWRNFLRDWPSFWREIDLSAARRGVRPQTFSSYLINSRYQVKSAVLKGLDLQQSKTLQRLTVKCKGLESLHIQSGGALCDSLLSGLNDAHALQNLILGPKVYIGHITLRKIMQRCKCLTTLQVESLSLKFHSVEPWAEDDCKALKSLSIRFSQDEPAGRYYARPIHLVSLHFLNSNDTLRIGRTVWRAQRDLSLTARQHHICPPSKALKSLVLLKGEQIEFELGNIADYVPNLEVFTLQNMVVVDHLYTPVGLNTRPEHQLTLPSSVQILSLKWTGIAMWISSRTTPSSTISNTTDLPKLLELTVHENGHGVCSGRLSDLLQVKNDLRPHTSKPSTLKKLDIGTEAFDVGDMQRFLEQPRLCSLESLTLKNSSYIDDRFVENTIESWKSIVHLDLSHTKITGVAIKKLVQSLPGLSTLQIDGCHDVSRDAVDWAKSTGIRVAFSGATR